MLTKFNVVLALASAFLLSACQSNTSNKNDDPSASMASMREKEQENAVERGHYLVMVGACGDCHTPKIMTPQGPIEDSTRHLAGHLASMQMPPVDPSSLKPGAWAQMAQSGTAFAGPWGISYTANLTPDSATGLGAWSEEVFIKTLRTGKHLGQPNGRPILPPMPWMYVSKMTDEDLRSVYAYLRSLPPVNNRVPPPTPPNEVKLAK